MLYVSDQCSARIIRIAGVDPMSDWSVLSPGPAAIVPKRPSGLRFASGRILVADMALNGILSIDVTTGATELLSSDKQPVGPLSAPRDVAVSAERIVVADCGNRRIVFGPRSGAGLWTAFGKPCKGGSRGAGEFLAPVSVHIDSAGRILVADAGLKRLVRIDGPDGNGWTEIPLPVNTRPYGLAGGPDNTILVTDQMRARVIAVAADGTVTTLLSGARLGDLIRPVTAATRGNDLIVADAGTNQLTCWTKDSATQTYHMKGRLGGDPGPRHGPRFSSVMGMTIGADA